ncbi:hypothetical protein H6A64_06620 [Lacrimispora saccharolytica]|nr:hypothetical protein [Lacrimispora saccharolytica]
MSLRKGMKVRIVTEEPFLSEIKNEVGTVHEIYEDMGVAIVKIPGGAAKVPIEFLDEVKEENPADQKPGTRLITKEEFEDAISKVSNPEKLLKVAERGSDVMTVMLVNILGSLIGKKISGKIFKDQSEIEITKLDFAVLLWSECGPEKLSADPGISGLISKKPLSLSVMSIMVLEEMVSVLFPDKEIGND